MSQSQQPTLVEVAQQENARLHSDPNVICVGPGLKLTGGDVTFQGCLQYYVKKKHATPDEIRAAGSVPIPDDVQGYRTDVIEQHLDEPLDLDEPLCPEDNGVPTGSRGSRKYDPLVGGTSTTVLSSWHSFPTGYGTLGGICFDAATGDAMAISNAHVWGEETGRDVIQPWMPVDEYLEAVVKLITCGPVVSNLVDWTAPSALTAGLAAGAAAVAAAAVASDVEDPSRWGQQKTPPPNGARTSADVVRLHAEYPEHPLPGYTYATRTRWDYTRVTDTGDQSARTEGKRVNEHVLEWKRVWTNRQQYRSGERVQICAEIGTSLARQPEDYFVVAQCFPTSNRERLVSRVLVPGQCRGEPPENVECLSFGQRPGTVILPPSTPYPFASGLFRFVAAGLVRIVHVVVDNGLSPDTALQIPETGLSVEFPAAQNVEVVVSHSHSHSPVKVFALDPVGRVVDQAVSGFEQRHLHRLSVGGPHVVAVRLMGAGGEGELHDLCIDRPLRPPGNPDSVRIFHYQGVIDLSPNERSDRWAAVLNVQTANNVPPGTDPVVAAQTIGGLTASANTAHLVGCVVVMALDHLFDVI